MIRQDKLIKDLRRAAREAGTPIDVQNARVGINVITASGRIHLTAHANFETRRGKVKEFFKTLGLPYTP